MRKCLVSFSLIIIVTAFLFSKQENIEKKETSKIKGYKMLSMSFSSSFELYKYTKDHTKNKIAINGDISENYYELLLGKEDSAEFSLYYRKLSMKSVEIANGLWDVEKTLVGLAFGKVVSIDLQIPNSSYRFPLEFSGGFYGQYATSKNYNFVSGIKEREVIEGEASSLNYGIYTGIRLRLSFIREKYRVPSVVFGFKYQYPLNEFEYNPDTKMNSFKLFRKFFYIGIFY